MSKPISPAEVGAFKAKTFPSCVFDAFNELIAANYSNGYATVNQKAVVNKILEKANKDIPENPGPFNTPLTSSMIFDLGWLNVEEAYRDAGWKVIYDKPAYNESYDASFTFRR